MEGGEEWVRSKVNRNQRIDKIKVTEWLTIQDLRVGVPRLVTSNTGRVWDRWHEQITFNFNTFSHDQWNHVCIGKIETLLPPRKEQTTEEPCSSDFPKLLSYRISNYSENVTWDHLPWGGILGFRDQGEPYLNTLILFTSENSPSDSHYHSL